MDKNINTEAVRSYFSRKNLQEIGEIFKPSKYRDRHKGISFLERYEKYVSPKRNEPINFLEIGILGGNSIRTWHAYFSNVSTGIIGLDIDPKCKKDLEDFINDNPDLAEFMSSIEIITGSQDDETLRDYISKKYKGLDVVIDDGSHINELTIKSFDLYWPLLKHNGVYIIEDTILCWSDLTEGVKYWPGMKYNKKDLEFNNEENNLNDFIIKKIIELNMASKTDIYSIDFYRSSIIFTKKMIDYYLRPSFEKNPLRIEVQDPRTIVFNKNN